MRVKPGQVLAKTALNLKDVATSIACKGTSVERTTYTINKKAFLFLGNADAMVKLQESISDARKVAGCKVGASGWTKVTWGPDAVPPLDLLKTWVEESYRLLAPPPKNPTRKK